MEMLKRMVPLLNGGALLISIKNIHQSVNIR